jgi:gamma-glutamyl-gamma-aminobutyrate hydrolase PuuD
MGREITVMDEQSRPLIGVVGGLAPANPVAGWPRQDTLVVPATIIRALHRAGGREAVLLPQPIEESEAKALADRFDGVLLLGGPDVDPLLYGEEPDPRTHGVDPQRDMFEIALIHAARTCQIPLFAICRGIQILNVAHGGSLEQHVPGRPGIGNHGTPGGGWSMHEVRVSDDSLAARVLGAETAEVSCHHHQALARLGPGLRATGWAGDGLIEVVEGVDCWLLGVQWHPEDTAAGDAVQQRLFDSLVREAASRRTAVA